MEVNLKRRACFTEIGYGKLETDMQAEFEKAAKIACERDAPVTITLNITVMPPKEQNIGQVKYDINTKLPKRQSISYDAEFDRSVVIATASRDLGTIQQSLYFDDEPTTQTQEKEVNNG